MNLSEFRSETNKGFATLKSEVTNYLPEEIGTVDSGLASKIDSQKESKNEHLVWDVDALFRTGIGHYNQAIAIRNKLLQLEESILRQQINFFFQGLRLQSQREELIYRKGSPICYSNLSVQSELTAANVNGASEENGLKVQIKALPDSENAAKTFIDDIGKFETSRIDADLAQLELTINKSKVTGSSTNYIQQFRLQKPHYIEEMCRAFSYFRSVAEGLPTVFPQHQDSHGVVSIAGYGISVSRIPNEDEEDFTDRLRHWISSVGRFLNHISERTKTHEFAFSLADTYAIADRSNNGLTIVESYGSQRDTIGEITVKTVAEAFTPLRNPRIVGYEVYVDDSDDRVTPELLQVFVRPPEQRVNGQKISIARELRAATKSGAGPLTISGAKTSFYNMSPIGEWRIQVARKTSKMSDVNIFDTMILIIHIAEDES